MKQPFPFTAIVGQEAMKQALVLTAIVIGFAMTALVVVLALPPCSVPSMQQLQQPQLH